jgi:hypothetical protein
MIILEKYDYFNRSKQYSPCGAMRSDVCAVGASDAFAGSGKSDAAPCSRSDVMCPASHAQSAHHLRSKHHAQQRTSRSAKAEHIVEKSVFCR